MINISIKTIFKSGIHYIILCCAVIIVLLIDLCVGKLSLPVFLSERLNLEARLGCVPEYIIFLHRIYPIKCKSKSI